MTPEDLSGVVFSRSQLERARDLLARAQGVRRAAVLYPETHPARRGAVRSLMDVIAQYHAEGVDIPLIFHADEILLGEQTLTKESATFSLLAHDLNAIGIGSLTLLRGLTAEELDRFVPALAMSTAEQDAAERVQEIVDSADLPHVRVAPVHELDQASESADAQTTEPRGAYFESIDLLREIEWIVRSKQTLSASRVRNAARNLGDNVVANRPTMLELAGLKSHDEYTFYHSVNVAVLSLALGTTLTHDPRFLISLGSSGLLHDIGKTGVEQGVLQKPGALTAEQWADIRMHPLHGAEVAMLTPGLDKTVVVVALEHHMRQDGTGYPEPRSPLRQHLASRIVAVADAYDAMTSRRSYAPARLQSEAIAILAEDAGRAFDPALVKLFIGLMGIYPPRSVLELSTGEVGVVLTSADDKLAPVVRIIADPSGKLAEPQDVDLSDPDQAEGRKVAAVLDPETLNVDVGDYLH